MTSTEIRFDDGAAYERYMGVWSQLAGTAFLEWLAPQSAQQWLDIGCGNGAFTEMLVETCSPSAIHGIVERSACGVVCPSSAIGSASVALISLISVSSLKHQK